ncbi:hypothetical protein N836_36550 [Leptolyngbya sp. Heron Island J]|nr:hypothetical protein N836_36550 [Leptolyngbya sp. Heron Island J]
MTQANTQAQNQSELQQNLYMSKFYMSNFFCSRSLGRQILALGALVVVVLTGCTPREECALINGALAEGNLRIQEINENNLGNAGYNQGIERQVGRIYFDISQVLDGLLLSNRRLQTIQFQLVEAYQQASDYRYQAAELIASNPEPSNQIKADIRTLQLDSEANVGEVTEALRKQCPI